jgi:hypothetical protein
MITPTKEFWNIFKNTEGALSCAEAVAIMQIASLAPEGTYMTMGSHKGKDSLAAATVLKKGIYYLIDPIYEVPPINGGIGRTVEELVFNANSEWGISVVAIKGISLENISRFSPYSYVFSDAGSHSDDLPMQEVKLLEDNMIRGGIIAFHDVFSQFIKQTEAYEYLLSTGKYEKIEINWPEIFDYVKEHDLEKDNVSWHQYPDLGHPPNFVGALKRK